MRMVAIVASCLKSSDVTSSLERDRAYSRSGFRTQPTITRTPAACRPAMEPALKNYVVATADSVASLEAAVEGLMAAGFLPQGGVAVAGGAVLQAMLLAVPAAASPAVPATQEPVLVEKRGSTSPPAPLPAASPPPQPPAWTSALPATRGELGGLRRGRSNRW